MGKDIWKKGSANIIEFVRDNLMAATDEMSNKLQSKSVFLDAEALKKFLTKVITE